MCLSVGPGFIRLPLQLSSLLLLLFRLVLYEAENFSWILFRRRWFPFVSGFGALYTQLSFWLSVPTDGRELDSGRQQLVRWRCCTDYNTDQCWRIRCRTALNDKVTLNILSTRHPLGAEVRYFSRSLSQASLEEFQNKSERSMPLRASVRVDSEGDDCNIGSGTDNSRRAFLNTNTEHLHKLLLAKLPLLPSEDCITDEVIATVGA